MTTTVTIVTFQAGDKIDAKAKIESLNLASGNLLIPWQQNNQVYVAKVVIS